MASCNLAQNEMGGKELLLKACQLVVGSTTDEAENLTITDHGAKVGDILQFLEIGANTVVNLTAFYYVKQIVDANTIKISLSVSGAAIEFDATEASLDIDLFKQIGGLRSKSFSFASEGIDITNEDSDEWSTMLDKAGIRSLSVSGDGVYSAASLLQHLIVNKFLINELTCLMFIEYKTRRLYRACFKITGVEVSGGHDGESSYSLSCESSGVVSTAVIPAA